MGGCATKPKVDDGKAPAPETDKTVVTEDVHATSIGTREIVFEEEDKDDGVISHKKSLSNLLNQAAEGKDKAESSNVEKGVQESDFPKQEQPSESVEQLVPSAAIGISDGLKAELKDAEVTIVSVPSVVTSETLKISEADTKVIAVTLETLTLETPKTSEVTKTEAVVSSDVTKTKEAAPKVETLNPSEVTKSESLKPTDVTKTKEAATAAASKVETPKPSEVTKTKEAATAAASKVETPKPSEVTKTDVVPPVAAVVKSETLKPSDVTKTDNNGAASLVQKTETLEPANATKKEDAKTVKPAESSKTNVSSAK